MFSVINYGSLLLAVACYGLTIQGMVILTISYAVLRYGIRQPKRVVYPQPSVERLVGDIPHASAAATYKKHLPPDWAAQLAGMPKA